MKTLAFLAIILMTFTACHKDVVESTVINKDNTAPHELEGTWVGGAIHSWDEDIQLYNYDHAFIDSVNVNADSIRLNYSNGGSAWYLWDVSDSNSVSPMASGCYVVTLKNMNGLFEDQWIIHPYTLGGDLYCEWKSCCYPSNSWPTNDMMNFAKQ